MKTKMVTVFEVGDYVRLVRDTKFGGSRKLVVVKVTEKQNLDGFFKGEVLTGTYVSGTRFHWANVELLTASQLKRVKTKLIKVLNIGSKTSGTIRFEKNKLVVGYNSFSLSEAKRIANFINSLKKV